MMAEPHDPVCPVCLRSDAERRLINSAVPYKQMGLMESREGKDHGFFIKCKACGEFVVTYKDDVNLKSARLRSEWNATHLSALLREQTCRGLPPFWLRYGMDPYGPLDWHAPLAPIDLEELLQRWPRTVSERIDRTLCNFASLSGYGGDRITINSDDDNALAFAKNIGEAIFHRQALVDQGYAVVGFEAGTPNREVKITPKGWARVEEITRGKSDQHNPVFVAMWFGGEEQQEAMDAAFQQAIHPAIEDAGYKAERVDLVQHNDWIMDKVLGLIRAAPFVVADFTGNRNGVYFEAGFARGLGIPVIHTCHAKELDNAHFDTRQLNHVTWESIDELRLKLHHRIVGSIGRGPFRHRK
jgi:hypothetical protein